MHDDDAGIEMFEYKRTTGCIRWDLSMADANL